MTKRNFGYLLIFSAVLYFLIVGPLGDLFFPCAEEENDGFDLFPGIGPCFGELSARLERMMAVAPPLAIAGIGLVAWDFFAKRQNEGSSVIRPPSGTPPPTEESAEPIGDDSLEKISKLSELHKAGAISDTEFERKKAELLDRI